MCGIAGFSGFNLDNDFIETVHGIQSHRGPDHCGTYRQKDSILLHQRLSIIDLEERSNQPFEKEGLVIVFNGEIYNYKSLRSTIIKDKGVTFKTESDTEVLLEYYRHYGAKSLNKLRGMFAFAVLHKDSGKIFIARDPFGVKPLFCLERNGKFAFSSELKVLHKLPGFNPVLNKKQFVAGLNYLWLPGGESIFSGITKLIAGHYLTFENGKVTDHRKYYSPSEEMLNNSENDLIETLDEVFRKSIDMHMVSDVPVSGFLSGGLDSSLICALASQKTDRLSTYTIGTSKSDKKIEKMPDDERYARELASKMGFDHQEIEINPDIVTNLPFITAMMDEPLGDPAAINTWLICKAARERGVKVMLSGMGADEIFFGYRRQLATLKAHQFKKLPGFTRKIIGGVVGAMPVKMFGQGMKLTRWAQRFMNFANLEGPEAYRMSYSYYSPEQLNNLLTEDVEQEITMLQMNHNDYFSSKYQGDLINQMCHTDIQFFMNGLNLTYTDRASMAASVEVRVPFIDREVIELAMKIPGKLKYKNKTQKYILKKVAEKYLPNDIIYRPKASFGAPIRSWISKDLSEMVGDMLSEKRIKERGLFNPSVVSRMIEDDRRGKADYAYQIYYLLMLENWFEAYNISP